MNQEHPSECPVSGGQSIPPPPLEYHDIRWDLSEDADRLCPIPSEHAESLEQCAKLAWRNSVRCIGRRLWKGLDVIDARSLKEPDDIFEALLAHLRKATNGGKIVPVMTVFREWLSNAPEIRIWNHQLIRYAGYETANGKRLGDPMNIELTRLALKLGWQPPSEPGHFDLLPIIIQSGEKIQWYELPKHEVYEVKIRHPKYPCIEKMELKWHAVPVVSDMIFATGSALHSCAPFSGYYLGTEIGARNFADPKRYNLLPELARGLGLDTNNRRSLWRDHALVILNEAVLWSFDTEGVGIADHHGASDDFLHFCKQETKAGRDVRAEWSWIVPPISGSATSVFHERYNESAVYPNFLLQVAAWETKRGQKLLASQRI